MLELRDFGRLESRMTAICYAVNIPSGRFDCRGGWATTRWAAPAGVARLRLLDFDAFTPQEFKKRQMYDMFLYADIWNALVLQ